MLLECAECFSELMQSRWQWQYKFNDYNEYDAVKYPAVNQAV